VNDQKLASMAWRNLWRNRRRTILTLASIAFGTFLAVIFTGMGDSAYSKMIDLAARLGGGHVTIQHPDALDKPALSRSVPGAVARAKRALADPDVSRVAVRISGPLLLSTARESSGAAFIAFDPAAEDTDSLAVIEDLSGGRMFQGSRDKGIILGAGLAENLRTGLGKKVVYTLTDKNGQIVNGLARVTGIMQTGAPTVDRGMCLLPIDTVRKVLGYAPDEASQVALFLDDNRKSQDVKRRMQKGPGRDLGVHTWDETQPELAGFIAMKVGGTQIFELIIMILVAAGIFNTLFISVMERLREFGIMTAIGFSPGSLFRLVMWESLWLGLMGLVFAVVLSAYPYYYLNTKGFDMSMMVSKGGVEVAGVFVDPIMYVSIYTENAVSIALVVLLATLVSGLYPAWRAGRVVPVETIKLV
jgi:ABC-type lipoprotein release transport system permease subunit